MATNAELKAEYADLKQQLADINTQISAIIQTKNKRYTYSNQETTHTAETQDLSTLRELRKDIKERMSAIEYQLTGIFVQIKNK